jgi:hypothetical protein
MPATPPPSTPPAVHPGGPSSWLSPGRAETPANAPIQPVSLERPAYLPLVGNGPSPATR